MKIPPQTARALSGALVRWFRASNRDLPWRRTRDPYAVWVSEIMLQQTRVDVVVPYYERFVDRYPTVHALADAPLDDVLHAWSGLGYYRRARQLHAAANALVRDHAGALPEDEDALLALPGIGRYTSGAIRSIAFGHAAPIVDGNVARVLSRLFALEGGPGDAEWIKRLWQLATALVPAGDPSAFNQGMMELGATVCVPRAPRCGECPLARFCRAHAAGREEAYPPPKPRAKLERVELWALVLTRTTDGAVLLRRRGADEHNAGFWEIPLTSAPGMQEEPQAHWTAAVRKLDAGFLGRSAIADLAEAGVVHHNILSTLYELRVFAGSVTATRAGAASAKDLEWFVVNDGSRARLTTIARKALAATTRQPEARGSAGAAARGRARTTRVETGSTNNRR